MIEQWTEGVHRITGNQGKGGEADASFLLDCGDELVLIETGSNQYMGREIIRSIEGLGRSPKEISHIFFTHSHPELLGGLNTILKHSGEAKILIHESAKPVFEEGKAYVLEKQFPLKTGGKISLAWKSSLFANYIGLPKPESENIRFLHGGEDIKIGEETFIIDKTGGHSSDSILIHAYNHKATFIGDELGVYDSNEYSFFFDLTGSPESRKKALRVCSRLKTDYIFPTHLSPIEKSFIDQDVEHAILAQQHFETTLIETISGFDSVRLDKIVDYTMQILHLDWQSPFKELKVAHSTISRYLDLLQTEEKIVYNSKTDRYSFNRESLDEDYDPYAPF